MASRFNRRGIAASLVAAVAFAAGLAAQTPAPQKDVPKVTAVDIRPILSIEGKDNFEAYCAVCHGSDAKGQGPAAPAMKAVVPDLTTIARRNSGKFDFSSVEYIIKGTGKTATPAHGVEAMPIWGDVFRSEDSARAALRIKNLVNYVRSIQAGTTSNQQ
jgi:mono/diheme cytochrome c family protein